jgi:phenylalanyl-tRNA synthetase beta subunit
MELNENLLNLVVQTTIAELLRTMRETMVPGLIGVMRANRKGVNLR